tara:strand:- start:9358 stop:10158 length:801 start_codon:yes stop_codon:yes gene_type:complete
MIKKLYSAIKNKQLKDKLTRYIVAVSYKLFNTLIFRLIMNLVSKNRRIIKQLGKKIPLIDNEFEKIANYYLPKNNSLNKNSSFASFGIGSDLNFEKEVYLKYGTRANCFDPTPRSKQLIEEINPLFVDYFEIGLNKTSGILKFYQIKPYSDFTLYEPKRFWNTFESECWSFEDLSKNLNIANFDLIKMDIEGAALPIVIDLCREENKFGILIAELELMSNKVREFESQLINLINEANLNSYSIFRLPKKKNNFTSIEVLILSSLVH